VEEYDLGRGDTHKKRSACSVKNESRAFLTFHASPVIGERAGSQVWTDFNAFLLHAIPQNPEGGTIVGGGG
jgi:hypothetical protein